MGMPAGRVPEMAERMGRQLNRMVLPTAKQLFRATGLSPRDGKEALKYLVREGMTEGFEVGALVPGVTRYRNKEKGLVAFEASEEQAGYHGDGAVGVLFQHHMPRVEAMTEVVDQYARAGWRISAVHRVEEGAMCAVVEFYIPGDRVPRCLVVYWASAMDTESELFYGLKAVPVDMRKRANMAADGDFSPSGLAVVGASEWIVARALTMACAVLDRWVPPSHITAWYASHDGWHVSDGPSVLKGTPKGSGLGLLPSVSELRPVASVKTLGGKYFDRLLRRLLWSGRAGQRLLELLTLVGDYPVGSVGQYAFFVGEGPDGKKTKKRMATLERLGLVEVATPKARAKANKRLRKGVPLTLSARGQGADRYKLTQSGRSEYCFFHGGKPGDLPKRTKLGRLETEVRERRHKGDTRKRSEMPVKGVEDQWPYRHEDIAYHLLAEFGRGGCPFAPGWQARTALANGQGLDPDGKVLLQGPFGPRWWNLEVELSDTSPSALRPRCEKLASPHRRDRDWVLLVLSDDRAEKNLHEVGKEFMPHPMILTTTLRRLKDKGPFGSRVWSLYGRPIRIPGPRSESE